MSNWRTLPKRERVKLVLDFYIAFLDWNIDHYEHFDCFPAEFEYNEKVIGDEDCYQLRTMLYDIFS